MSEFGAYRLDSDFAIEPRLAGKRVMESIGKMVTLTRETYHTEEAHRKRPSHAVSGEL